MVDPKTNTWDTKLLEQLGLPSHFLSPIQDAGTVLGQVRSEVLKKAGIDYPVKVILPGTHDTASAIAAVPVADEQMKANNWAYLSSGTWSLIGAELDQPLISEASYQASFTNERGVENKIRFLKNIAGLWLVQQTRADFIQAGQTYDYAELTQMAAESQPFRTLIDTQYEPLASPGDFREKITTYAQQTNQPIPETPGQFVRCCLESLALAYRQTLEQLDELLNRKTQVLHIVGGGGKNELLNQMTADAIGCPVIVGPYEGTAIGNALTQAMGDQKLDGLSGIRQVVRQTFELKTFEPNQTHASAWQEAASRLR